VERNLVFVEHFSHHLFRRVVWKQFQWQRVCFALVVAVQRWWRSPAKQPQSREAWFDRLGSIAGEYYSGCRRCAA